MESWALGAALGMSSRWHELAPTTEHTAVVAREEPIVPAQMQDDISHAVKVSFCDRALSHARARTHTHTLNGTE